VLRNGGSISTVALGVDRGGDLFVDAEGDVVIDGEFAGPSGPEPSGLFARSGLGPGTAATGDAGNLTVEARSLQMTGGALISARTFGAGNAGIVDITTADSIVLRGDARGTPEISVRALDGDAGGVAQGVPGLVLRTGSLEILDGGAVTASTAGTGNAGDVHIEADRVRIEGATGPERSAIYAASVGSAVGDAGRIEMVVARDMIVGGGGRISVLNEGSGESGSIDVSVGGSLKVTSGGEVTTQADAASGGSITIRSLDSVEIVDGTVTTSVLGSTLDSNAGDITIESGRVIVNRGTVIAEAIVGAGGNINITTGAYVESVDSTVDASSERGIDGEVKIDAPDNQLKGDVPRVDLGFLDATALLKAHCAARVTGSGSFVVIEREGLGETGDGPLSSSVPLEVLLDEDDSSPPPPASSMPNASRWPSEQDCARPSPAVASQGGD
jgi:hypothetical protein